MLSRDRKGAESSAILFLLLLTLPAHAEIIDRIAVSVGNRVITQSDLERQIRVIAFQNGTKPDFSSANKHAVVDKMIQQKIIQRELENSRYPLPLPAELVPAVEEFKRTHFPDDAAYQRALGEYDITEQDLLDVLLWERTLLRFIELRFETGIQVTPQEVDAYALQKNIPAASAERALISDRADVQVDQWLREVRRRTDVIVHEEVLQ
jgi:peptidyl-prolyl cis-trans isomerase SurA